MNRGLVLAEWVRAKQSLRAAEILVREGCFEDTVSRAYYATLHAAKAALLVHDVAADSHRAVKRLFGLHLISHQGRLHAERLARRRVGPAEFDKAESRLSDTKPFQWRRNLPPLEAKRTVFNYVATYNDFERRFAQFLDKVSEVARFASLGTTEQGDSGTKFRVDYIKPTGAIGFYHPDWVVVQKTDEGPVNWIIETKGRVWEDTKAKDTAMNHWCEQITQQSGERWEFKRVNQIEFERAKPSTLAEAVGRGPKLF